MSYDFSINDDSLNLFDRRLAISEVNSSISDSSFFSIKQSLKAIKKDDVLVTLPTSKDKFIESGKQFAGHTDYFRHVYPEHSISMNFVSEYEKITLLTDHVPLVKVPEELKNNNFEKNIAEAINQYDRFFQNQIKKVLICGINPHAGESGLIGNEDYIIENGIKKLKTQFPQIEFSISHYQETRFFWVKTINNQHFTCTLFMIRRFPALNQETDLLGLISPLATVSSSKC